MVPDDLIAHAVSSVGTKQLASFPERKYVDVRERRRRSSYWWDPRMVLRPRMDPKFGFDAWVDAAVSMVEVGSGTKVLVWYSGDAVTLPDTVS